MEPECTRHLREIKEAIKKISATVKDRNPEYAKEPDGKILGEIAATTVGSMSETATRLLKKLDVAGKTSKYIDQRYAKIIEAHSNMDVEEIAKIIDERMSNLENTYEEEIAGTTREQGIFNIAGTDENVTKGCVQDQDSVKHANSDEEKDKGSIHGIHFSPAFLEKSRKEHKTFLVQLNVSNFSAKDVKIKVHEKYLEIHAKHDRLIDEHGIISREFTRKFDIPEGVDPETFRALYDCYGVLHVEASFASKNKPRGIKVLLDEETGEKNDCESFEDLGKEFEELIRCYMQDGYEMAEFARNLAKQSPSDYIPIDEVIP